MIKQQLLKLPGFLYQVENQFYFLGKWICTPISEVEISDCLYMFEMDWESGNHPEARTYFLKIRAHCDFALEIPYNPKKIESSLDHLLSTCSPETIHSLEKQIQRFETANQLYT